MQFGELLARYGGFINMTAFRMRHLLPRAQEISDLAQVGRIMLWRETDKIAAMSEELHRHRYVKVRIRGSMLDEIRSSYPRRSYKNDTRGPRIDEYLLDRSYDPGDVSLEPSGLLSCKNALQKASRVLSRQELDYMVWALTATDEEPIYSKRANLSDARASQVRRGALEFMHRELQ